MSLDCWLIWTFSLLELRVIVVVWVSTCRREVSHQLVLLCNSSTAAEVREGVTQGGRSCRRRGSPIMNTNKLLFIARRPARQDESTPIHGPSAHPTRHSVPAAWRTITETICRSPAWPGTERYRGAARRHWASTDSTPSLVSAAFYCSHSRLRHSACLSDRRPTTGHHLFISTTCRALRWIGDVDGLICWSLATHSTPAYVSSSAVDTVQTWTSPGSLETNFLSVLKFL